MLLKICKLKKELGINVPCTDLTEIASTRREGSRVLLSHLREAAPDDEPLLRTPAVAAWPLPIPHCKETDKPNMPAMTFSSGRQPGIGQETYVFSEELAEGTPN